MLPKEVSRKVSTLQSTVDTTLAPSEDLTATATTETDLVTRSCDDWGLRSADRGTQGFWTTERW